MLLSDIAEYVMLDSGSFIIGDMTLANIDMNRFWRLVKRDLAYYNKYTPVTKYINLQIGASPYIFPDVPGNPAPEWISKIYPTGIASNFSLFGLVGNNSDPVPVVYRYTKPNLWIANAATIECTCHYNRNVTITYLDDSSTKINDIDISNLDETDIWFQRLVTANFMIAVGRSRRAFLIGDFPISMDSAELVAEGLQQKLEAEQMIMDQGKWQYSIGG
jgi:hypothetical protein